MRVPVACGAGDHSCGVERIVRVSDEDVKAAVRLYYSDTHHSRKAQAG